MTVFEIHMRIIREGNEALVIRELMIVMIDWIDSKATTVQCVQQTQISFSHQGYRISYLHS